MSDIRRLLGRFGIGMVAMGLYVLAVGSVGAQILGLGPSDVALGVALALMVIGLVVLLMAMAMGEYGRGSIHP